MKLLVAYESSAQYRPRFDFYGIGERSVRTNVSKEMDKARRRKLIAEAELAELELQKERGEVVSIEETEKSWR